MFSLVRPGFANLRATDAEAPLVLRFGALGDAVMATPVLRALARRHGRPCSVLGRGAWLPQLYRGLPFVGDIHVLDSLKTPYWLSAGRQGAVAWLRDRQPCATYVLDMHPPMLELLWRSDRLGRLGSQSVGDLPGEHLAQTHARMCGLLLPAADLHAELQVSPDEALAVRQQLASWGWHGQPLVLVHPGNRKTRRWGRSRHDVKAWPTGRWREVVAEIVRSTPESLVLVTGVAAEAHLASVVAAGQGRQVIPVAGRLGMRGMIALISEVDAMVSIDTGAAHVAAAVGTPLVVLFAAQVATVNRPIPRRSPIRIVESPGPIEALPAAAAIAAWHGLAASRWSDRDLPAA